MSLFMQHGLMKQGEIFNLEDLIAIPVLSCPVVWDVGQITEPPRELSQPVN